MTKINWDEYKAYKKQSHKSDNFEMLLDFIDSYYNMTNPSDIYESLASDDLGQMMLRKRDIVDAVGLEMYKYNLRHG